MNKIIKKLSEWANGPWYCTYCGAMYSTDAEGAAHMASAHPNY